VFLATIFKYTTVIPRRLPTNFSKPIQVDLPISHAGAFVYWVEYDGDVQGERVKGREGYFNIDPILRTKARSPILSSEQKPLSPSSGGAVIKSDLVNLPLDGLSILTVISKWMGPMSGWRDHFSEASDRGYTMLHWTPLQERGESSSPFSIKDQMKYDPAIFGGKPGPDGGKAKVEEMLKVAREEYGLLSLTDVVLNHTASDSPWLVEHPEAGEYAGSSMSMIFGSLCGDTGYSPANTPHLTPALELDTTMIEFSASLASKGLPVHVKTQQDIDTLINAFEKDVRALNLWQYYVLDVTKEKASIKSALSSGSVTSWKGPDVKGKSVVEIAEIVRSSGLISGFGKLAARFGVRVDGSVAAGLVNAAFVNIVNDVEALTEAWGSVVDALNAPLYDEWEEDTKIALENAKNELMRTRLEEGGPKMGEISEK
jgi:glycogen debranching enzyme